jgi:hypothetical protein
VLKFPLRSLIVVLLGIAVSARAVILFDDPDPPANRIAPTGALAGSGWQYQGQWGVFLGTPISPHFFLSAAHIGRAGSAFSYNGVDYSPVAYFNQPGSDLMLWRVAETFPSFAPLYTAGVEKNQHLVVIGRGTDRGSEVTLSNTPRGWDWGAGNHVQRWGENDVFDVVPYQGHDLLYALFDQHPNESHLSGGDSGGAIFLNDGGSWKLGGINFAVDDLYSAPNKDSEFVAAVFDARGFYTSDEKDPPTFSLIAGTNPVPTGFYSSRISSELAWIGSVIADPHPGREGNLLTVTYSRLIAPASDIGYVVEQSTDLVSWSVASPTEEIVSSNPDIEVVKATVDPGASPTLFLRVRVTRP